MKIETTHTRIGVCANCGGRGCDQCRAASANVQCINCGGSGCVQCRQAAKDKGNLDGWTEVACYVAQTNPHDWTKPAHLLALSLLDCGDGNAMLVLSVMPDEDQPAKGWESAGIIVAMDWWKHIQHAPEPPDQFTVTTFETDDGPKLAVATMIPQVWDEMSFFELSMNGLSVVGWADALDAKEH